jgi:hypothetical protein
LTHPEWWWRKEDIEPGEKVCRLLASRRELAWRDYCALLDRGNRNNRIGLNISNHVLFELFGDEANRLLMLWCEGFNKEIFIEIFGRLECQIRHLIQKCFRYILKIPSKQINILLEDCQLGLDPLVALSVLLERSVLELTGLNKMAYRKLKSQRERLVKGYSSIKKEQIKTCFEQTVMMLSKISMQEKEIFSKTKSPKNIETENKKIKKRTDSILISWLKENLIKLELTKNNLDKFLCQYN